MLMITGTADDTLEHTSYTTLLESFADMKAGTKKQCAVIHGATDMNLGGKGLPLYRKTVCLLISHFMENMNNDNSPTTLSSPRPGVLSLQSK